MRVVRELWTRESGSAAVEFALITPILLLFLLGIFEFGRAWSAKGTITEAARVGARVVAVTPSANGDSVRAAVNRALRSGALDTTRATITITGLTAAAGQPASVSIDYTYSFLFWRDEPRPNTPARTSVLLRTASTMRKE